MVANVYVGMVLGQVVQLRRERTEHGVLIWVSNRGRCCLPFLPQEVSPLAGTLGVVGWTSTFESEGLDRFLSHGAALIQPKASRSSIVRLC